MKGKGFAPLPKKYPPQGRWFCSCNWENGFYSTLDECLNRIQHCFSSDELLGADLFLFSLPEKADPNNAAHQAVVRAVESKIQEDENQLIVKVRAEVRNRCLREGSAEGGSYSNQWDIRFQGKGGNHGK
jgi:hypothetical protein